jgi:hypothetical protein
MILWSEISLRISSDGTRAAGRPLSGVGGLGLAALAFLVTIVSPGTWCTDARASPKSPKFAGGIAILLSRYTGLAMRILQVRGYAGLIASVTATRTS